MAEGDRQQSHRCADHCVIREMGANKASTSSTKREALQCDGRPSHHQARAHVHMSHAQHALGVHRAPLANPKAVKPSPMAPSRRKKLRTLNTLASDRPAQTREQQCPCCSCFRSRGSAGRKGAGVVVQSASSMGFEARGRSRDCCVHAASETLVMLLGNTATHPLTSDPGTRLL